MKKDKSPVVLISGGSRGLGAALCQHFLESGARVATFSRSKTDTVSKLEKKYPGHFFYQSVSADSKADVRALVEAAEKKFGTVDILINNAAVVTEGVFPIFPEDAIDKIVDVNLKGALFLTRAVSRLMLKKNSGKIINIVSIVGLRGYAGLTVYAATKAAMIGFTSSLARELGPKNIKVNAVAPGYIETEMSDSLSAAQRSQIVRRTPLGRLGKTQDILPVIDFLAGPESDFVTGQVIVVDGGITC